MMKNIIRIIVGLIGAFFGYGVSLLLKFLYKASSLSEKVVITDLQQVVFTLICAIIFGLLFFYLLTPVIRKQGVRVASNIEKDLQKVSANDMVSGTFGLIVGLFIAFLISQIYSGIGMFYIGTILSIITYFIMGYLGVVIATKKGKELIASIVASRKGPTRGKGKSGDASVKILDTSVIIDGRIADIMKTGFIEGNIVIPEFVLVELRHIADSSDSRL